MVNRTEVTFFFLLFMYLLQMAACQLFGRSEASQICLYKMSSSVPKQGFPSFPQSLTLIFSSSAFPEVFIQLKKAHSIIHMYDCGY